MNRKIFTICTVLLAAILLSFNSHAQVKVGSSMPAFSYEKAAGSKASSSALKGKVVLINFFATWCPPCQKELPEVEAKIWKKLKGNSNFVMLTFGREHSWKEVNDYKASKGFTFPIYPDPKKEVFMKFAPNQIPRSYLIDKSGKVVYATKGFSNVEFQKMVNKLNSIL